MGYPHGQTFTETKHQVGEGGHPQSWRRVRAGTVLRAQAPLLPPDLPPASPPASPESTGLCQVRSPGQAGWEPGALRQGRGRYGGGVSHRLPHRQPGAQKALAGTRGTTWRPGRWSWWKAPEWAASAAAGSYFWVPGGRGWCCWGGDTCRSHAGLGVRVGLITGVAGVRMATGKGQVCD